MELDVQSWVQERRMDFMTSLRVLVLSHLALAIRDPKDLALVIDGLAEMLGAALVVRYRDDVAELDLACTALEGVIHVAAIDQREKLRALGVFDWDGEP